MYHIYFYAHYMQRRFGDLSHRRSCLNRGMITGTEQCPVIYIDRHAEENSDIKKALVELYRLPETVLIVSR